MIIAFYNQGFLVEREAINALRKLPGVKLVVIEIVSFPTAEQAEIACKVLIEQKCRAVVTINDWGMDWHGVTAAFLQKNGILHINWCVDDPFFIETMHGVPLPCYPNRIDFVSDRGYVQPMKMRGVQAHFLPLATDPSIFYPLHPRPEYLRDVCFIGSSYVKEVEDYIGQYMPFIEERIGFVHELIHAYKADMNFDIGARIYERLGRDALPEGLTRERAILMLKYFIGYSYRKQVVTGLASRFPDFKVFGDAEWTVFLPREKVAMAVGYYINLNETYQQTRVNIDINRAVIRDGFTQRVFDCGASGSFVITSAKPIMREYFECEGPDREVVLFDNEEDLMQKAEYYRTRDAERTAITRRAREKVSAHHTYDHRIHEMFAIIRDAL